MITNIASALFLTLRKEFNKGVKTGKAKNAARVSVKERTVCTSQDL